MILLKCYAAQEGRQSTKEGNKQRAPYICSYPNPTNKPEKAPKTHNKRNQNKQTTISKDNLLDSNTTHKRDKLESSIYSSSITKTKL